MNSLPIHEDLEALAQDPFSLDPIAWDSVRGRIDGLIGRAVSLDWSDEAIERERGHVPHMRAHIYVLQLQYIGIRGTNKVMHLLRNTDATARSDLDTVDNIQRACHRFERTNAKYRPLRALIGKEGAAEAHGYFLTLLEARFDDLTAVLQRLREQIMLSATQSGVEMARREPRYEETIHKRLSVPPLTNPTPEETENALKAQLDSGTWPPRAPLPVPRNDDDDMALRVVTAYLEKLRADEKDEDKHL